MENNMGRKGRLLSGIILCATLLTLCAGCGMEQTPAVGNNGLGNGVEDSQQSAGLGAAEDISQMVQIYLMELEEGKQAGKTECIIEYNRGLSCAIQYPVLGMDRIDQRIYREVTGIYDSYKEQFGGGGEPISSQEQCENVLYMDYNSYMVSEKIVGIVLYESLVANEANVASSKVHTFNFNLETGEELTQKMLSSNFLNKLSASVRASVAEKEAYQNALFQEEFAANTAPDSKALTRFVMTDKGINVYFEKYSQNRH